MEEVHRFRYWDRRSILGFVDGTENPERKERAFFGLIGDEDPAYIRNYPDAIAQAVSQLRLAGVNGPYALVLGNEPYTTAGGGSDEGYPVLEHIRHLVDGEIVWAPAIEGGFVLSTRGGDFELSIGQDISIGYLSHNETNVKLYFQESFTFQLFTSEAVIALTPSKK